MAFVSMKNLLAGAKDQHYAIGQFNINGLQWTKAILQAAEEERSPVIAAASDRLIDYLGGFKTVAAMVAALVEEMSITVPVVLHLDHGSNPERCKKAIDAGFSSVMIDGSHSPIDENIAMTKEVAAYAQPYNVSVEAEVGTVGGMEDGLIGGVKYADIHECERLVKEADIDALAAALGSVHGKYQGEPHLGFKEMEEISRVTDIPLVLHGASGIPTDQIAKAIRLGHAKININTECMVAWTDKTRSMFKENLDLYEPRAYMTPGISAVKETVKLKMREFGSSGKAAYTQEIKV
ncbi:class II fructose-1,6-bisphosphate aldolase [Bacillus swezeyi]|uniref:Class II fructose-1,6-bisphosphate aldolase n=2 Tax=Bacillus TaxID=1386 RepID=A0A5M8RGC4_9BACI|nr:class II fructose-1,6-bisphosphate aldolase [Bacillus swezeyi]KAA6447279.1 class II fructose-1,6-bisphosphate aldolase [Bacillus swezeyi]KAA6472969.1 class II fructose-1,6-bisphosphate aldolase [Bacillus swezeyi]TYS32820.1 class II fructose-1,6-bisphosphate aldolase [Bacillus swezeyi]